MDASREYERRVMAGQSEAAPPAEYVMSDAFRDWLVERMRVHVMAQVGGAGLDRMAMVKVGGEEE